MQSVVRFGPFELRSTERCLLSAGQAVPLGSRAFEVLLALVTRGGELVTKEELLQQAWPGLVVEEANVHVAVSQLRKVLGKAAIATVGGLGYRFAWPLLAVAPPAPRLPMPRAVFVGRQAELDELGVLLGPTRLLTLVAMGGMGKTRLALQLAHKLYSRYADGAAFVDLQPLQDGSGVPAAVARALGLDTASGATAAGTTELLLRHLQDRDLLLVLDNCEQVRPAVQSLVTKLLPQAAALKVLATSRQALELPGERVFALRPLALVGTLAAAEGSAAGSAAAAGFAASGASEAMQFFVLRAQADDPDFALDKHNAPLVADICQHLDGIPLALELAAARLKMLSLQQLQSLLAQRFELLSRSTPGGTTRQQTLQDVLHWSHEHLEPAEQALAQAVAVCSGGFDLDTAVALARAGDEVGASSHMAFQSSHGTGAVAVLDGLAQLAERALIHVTHGGETARYGLLETVREYLRAQLRASGRCDDVQRRHGLHFHALALRAEAATAAGQDAARWAQRLDSERDNLLLALTWCIGQGAAQRGLEMVVALKGFWFASGRLEQGLQATQAVLSHTDPAAPSLLAARVHRLGAQLCLFMQRLDEGAAHARLALAASQALDDEAGAAAALCFAGRIAVKLEDRRGGTQLLQEGLRRARRAGALAVVGEALNALAFAAIEVDDLDAAEAHFGAALLVSQQRGSSLGSIIETLNLAWVAVMKQPLGVGAGALERARQLLLSVWHSLQDMPHRYVAQEFIDVCASFALRGGWTEEAALLHAASATQRAVIQLPMEAKQAAQRASEAVAARAALGDAAYEASALPGPALSHEATLARLGAWLQAAASAVPAAPAAPASRNRHVKPAQAASSTGLSRLVYSTEQGRSCPQCRQAWSRCTCAAQASTLPQGDGKVRVSRVSKGRGGKTVTLVRGLPLLQTELEVMAKLLRSHCGSGGTVKDGVVEVQGDHADRVLAWLQAHGHPQAKRAGG